MDLSRNENDLLTIESARASPATGKESQNAAEEIPGGSPAEAGALTPRFAPNKTTALQDVIRKELAIAKQKQSVLDRIKHWKKELGARPEDKDADALADALFDKIVKGEQEELAAIGDYNKEGVQSFVQAVQDDE
ncbi:hypothetical protein TGAM01_v210917 [Trichoderma gamsii]|uniref:Uncharacterized protein n=1 Tax=Trichoderma gamsii TaxID=398673 RepID=A0A2P4Z7H4_9HYPO|nr:hypothetical protein TGAM01_v210917 [Trichoderma gamsii]PON20233.1 hypothetical protein TGAM01_v210917 [Trichoderma gamsii]